MRSSILSCALLVCAVLAAAPASAQPATDFRLPPDPQSTSTSSPQAEGPVDLEGDTRSAPRVIGTPTPTPRPSALPSPRATAPQPTATPSASPAPRPTATGTGRALPASDGPVPTRQILSEPQGAPVDPAEQTGTAQSAPDEFAPEESVTESAESTTLPGAVALPDSEGGDSASQDASRTIADMARGLPVWIWGTLAAALLLLLALAVFLLARRRRKPTMQQAEVADLSGPPLREVGPASSLAQPAAPSLEVEAHAVTLSRSVMNASISYRVTMVNRGREPITLIEVHGDVTTAHGRVPAAQQLADTEQSFPELHTHARLAPGERITMRGELRLPLREIRALRQGSVPVFVPLLRLTVRAQNMQPKAYTYVIGTRAAEKGSRPNPFRLDEPPRSYAQLTTRALA